MLKNIQLYYNSNQKMVKTGSSLLLKTIIIFAGFVVSSLCYIDIQVAIQKKSDAIAYNIPIQINSHAYKIQLSLENKQQFIVPLDRAEKLKKEKKNHKNPKNLFGLIKVTSLEGYTFEGWKRFFMEALLYIQQRYYHQITINLDFLKQKQGNNELSTGLMTFGPNIQNNTFFNQIKKNTQYITQNIIAIYGGKSNGKNVRIQLGGFQQSFAYGHKNGYLFDQVPLKYTNTSWLFEPQKIFCSRQKSKQWQQYGIVYSEKDLLFKLNIQSQLLILPDAMKQQVQRNFLINDGQCFVENQMLTCKNMSNIDLALSMFSFKIGDAFMNISLYDLRDTYIENQKKTTFFVKFDANQENWQIGSTILKSHYIAIHLTKKVLIFSPINRFPDTIFSSVYLIRFIVGFILFTCIVGVGASIWQNLSNPHRRNVMKRQKDGVRLVSYASPMNQGDQDD